MVSELNAPTYFGICDHFIYGLRSLAVAWEIFTFCWWYYPPYLEAI